MHVACLGAGPAGLYLAILMKRADPAHDVVVFERCGAEDAPGWGIVFSDRTLEGLRQADPESHAEILRAFRHWDEIDIFIRGDKIRTGGHGFAGIGRARLLSILRRRATELGVELRFGNAVTDPDPYCRDYDVVVAADGVNSATRERYADVFRPSLEPARCRYIWLGTRHPLDAFTFSFADTEWGWFNLHAYRFDAEWSTCIIETPEDAWRRAGLDRMSTDESIAFCQRLFKERLGGQPLLGGCSPRCVPPGWQQFRRVLCQRWHHRNLVLIGDAAHTAHFAIGSGTKLAMEDAIALAEALGRRGPGKEGIEAALAAYQQAREPEALKLQNAARNRMEWFENVARHMRLEPLQFSYSLLTGSQRLGHASLRLRDPAYADRVESWVAQRSGLPAAPRPPMFTPFRIGRLELANRVVVSPMATYSSTDGVPGDFHLVHLGGLALGGAALVMTEMTAVSPDGRISPRCTGIWNDAQAAAWHRIVDFVHDRGTAARIGLQLGHAGAKGSTRVMWEGMDEPLAGDNWPLIAASALPWGPHNQTPRAMSREDMDRVRDDFAAAARRAAAAGFDLLELHCAHGYLLSGFLSPLSNLRTDAYGGSLENRARFPLEVFAAVRAAWPADRPISVRISAVDWAPGGNTPADGVAIARLFKAAGADLIDVSSGLTSRDSRPTYGRMFQTPLAEMIRNEAGVATMAVGNIAEADDVNTIIASGRADLCAIGRPHLADPHWTQRAAALLGWPDAGGPPLYEPGRRQLEARMRRHRAREQ